MTLGAYVEINKERPQRLELEDDTQTGNALATFTTHLTAYCSGLEPSNAVRQWFVGIERPAGQPICSLSDASYGGNWDYSEDEYERFVSEHPNLSISEEDFIRGVRHVRGAWTDISKLLPIVIALTRSPKSTVQADLPNELDWMDLGDVVADMMALSRELEHSKEIGAQA